jgi:hypothetical protein
MRARLVLIALLTVAAACNGTPRRPPTPPPVNVVTFPGHKVAVNHFVKDPNRRYPPGPSSLCSWDRDRYLHFFSTDIPAGCEVAFLDAAGNVVEVAPLPARNEEGVTSKFEVRHALILDAGSISVADTVSFPPAVKAARFDPMPVVKIAGAAVHVETAHTLAERLRGLMHRPRLSANDGMLFLYPAESERSFYMKNTLISLDIAYFNAKGELLNVRRMKAPKDPAQGAEDKAPSAGPAQFVLEVNYGWFDARELIDEEGLPKKPVAMEIPAQVRALCREAH